MSEPTKREWELASQVTQSDEDQEAVAKVLMSYRMELAKVAEQEASNLAHWETADGIAKAIESYGEDK